jgi:hypothetical protein
VARDLRSAASVGAGDKMLVESSVQVMSGRGPTWRRVRRPRWARRPRNLGAIGGALAKRAVGFDR